MEAEALTAEMDTALKDTRFQLGALEEEVGLAPQRLSASSGIHLRGDGVVIKLWQRYLENLQKLDNAMTAVALPSIAQLLLEVEEGGETGGSPVGH